MRGLQSARPSPERLRPQQAPGTTGARRGSLALRFGLGIIWSLNLIYIVDPASQYFSTFSKTAASFGSSTLGGPALASLVARSPVPFEILIAGVTAYLAAAFLLVITTRSACIVGAGLNFVLLLTQFGGIATIPGSTDVGPQPLYLVMYVATFLGSASSGRSPVVWWKEHVTPRPILGSSHGPTVGHSSDTPPHPV